MTRRAAVASFLALAACAGERRDAPDSAPRAPVAAWDSLALAAPGNVEIWFIGQREARDGGGTPCVERAMEIRREGGRIAIPLLYTGEAPTLANDSTLRAHLWLHCRAGRLYEVNLRTGRPVPAGR